MGESPGIDSLKTLEKYTLIEKLSDGYLGTVYRSFDQDRGCAVEVRILCDSIKWDAEIVDLFKKECESVASLQHPNIAAIIEVCTEGRFPFIVMEPLGNRNLKTLIEQNPEMSFETKISIMLQVAEGLAYAHKSGILHRNLCPENLHMASDGCIKIRDFSIAHVLMKHVPHPGVRYGAPIYLSPEQIKHKQCDVQSDIFALGTVFYELLTGVHPFYDPDSNKALDNILQNKPIPTFELYPDFHPRIWQILKMCLAKNPEDRFGNVDELLSAYHSLLNDMSEDVQLMLSELQASFTYLKIAAESPNASEITISLFNDIQNLLRSEGAADYRRLDLLITTLIENYPEIREIAGNQKILNSVLLPQHPLEELLQPENAENPADSDAAISFQVPVPLVVPQLAAEEVSPSENHSDPVPGKEEAYKGDPVIEAPVEEVQDVSSLNVPLEPESEDSLCSSTDFKGTDANDCTIRSDDNGTLVEPVQRISDTEPDTISAVMEQEPAEVVGKPKRRRASSYWKNFSIPRPSHRTMTVLAFILLGVVAVYAVQGQSNSLIMAWKNFVVEPLATVKASAFEKAATFKESSSGTVENIKIDSAEILDDESNAEFESALMEELAVSLPGDTLRSPSRKRIDRVAALIGSGKLKQAQNELDRLRHLYPDSTDVDALFKQWQATVAQSRVEQKRKQTNSRETVQKKEDSWDRQFVNFFSQGKYKEAENVVSLWLGDLPGNRRAQESGATVKEIRTRIADCNTAITEGRYRDALGELDIAERINPTDPNIAVLRQEIESRKSTAMGTLTVHRLGEKAALTVDGKRLDNDGEIQEINIPIGSHTVVVEKDGYLVTSRSQELFERQSMVLVYDLDQRNIRPMIESDQILLNQRKAMEKIYRFQSEHKHGLFRGGCQGDLIISYYEVIFETFSGEHGFRIPFKLLKLEQDEETIDLYFIMDNEHFQKFQFENEETAFKFNQTWKRLKSLLKP